MSYSINYKTCLPYNKWHEEILFMKQHVERRCEEIEAEYDRKSEEYLKQLEQAYMKGEEYGIAFEQQETMDDALQVRKQELISLEGEIKSTLEKTLKDIVSTFNLPVKRRGSWIDTYIRTIQENTRLDMSDFATQKDMIDTIRHNRNAVEHQEDAFLRNINKEYVIESANTVYEYVEALIQRLYQNKRE